MRGQTPLLPLSEPFDGHLPASVAAAMVISERAAVRSLFTFFLGLHADAQIIDQSESSPTLIAAHPRLKR